MLAEFGRFLREQAEDDDGGGGVDRHVEALVQRIAEAVLLPDRRAAMQELRDVLVGSPHALNAFGAVGLPAMLDVVREREDLEMVQLALECLAAAVGGGDAAHAGAGAGPSQAVAINAQQLARAPDGLPLLLSLLEAEPGGSSDFYARYHTLQVLKGLSAAAPLQLQQVRCGCGGCPACWRSGASLRWILVPQPLTAAAAAAATAGHPGRAVGHDAADGPAGRAGGAAQ